MSQEEDWDKATSFLQENGYLWEAIDTTNTTSSNPKSKNTIGLVFAHPTRVNTLSRRGFLTLFDSSHKLNTYNYNVFTFMCRDEYGIWVPGAHALVECENSDILCIALQRIKFWTSGQWKMVYALTDDSAVEQRAVKNAFPTAVDPDTKNHFKKHFLCTVHSERTLKRRFGSSELRKCFDELRYAMFCRTEAHCLTHIHEAIAAVPLPDVKNHQGYIEREWLATRTQWAMYARQHNEILLQVTTTNFL